MIKITIKQGNIISESADAIINPTNTFGIMNSGVSKMIKNVGGVIIESELVRICPIKIGEAVDTEPGLLNFKKIIHTPTIEHPLSGANAENIKKATKAALTHADKLGFKKIAMPGLGTGVGGFEQIDAAQIMINEIKNFAPRYLNEIILIDISEIMINAFKEALNED